MSPLYHRQSQGFPPGLVPSTARKLLLKRAGAKNLSLYPITASDWMMLAVSHDAEVGLEVIHPGCWGNCPISAQRKGEGGLPQSRGLFCLPYWATPCQGRVLCSRDPRTLCSLCSPPPPPPISGTRRFLERTPGHHGSQKCLGDSEQPVSPRSLVSGGSSREYQVPKEDRNGKFVTRAEDLSDL
ncbi:uncharacterized protein LOC124092090 isoform X9 [Marmota monax]|uniref:uncharacterized protein LOC124092090 isoform X9 n=1 Tax=Marmota monax TaxID=9995 RepID=UPI0026F1D0E4|nr:uncharacterized protein LOC124092090 isoform X9 [Marmota monax]